MLSLLIYLCILTTQIATYVSFIKLLLKLHVFHYTVQKNLSITFPNCAYSTAQLKLDTHTHVSLRFHLFLSTLMNWLQVHERVSDNLWQMTLVRHTKLLKWSLTIDSPYESVAVDLESHLAWVSSDHKQHNLCKCSYLRGRIKNLEYIYTYIHT